MEELCQTGRIMALNGRSATVRFVRSDACGHCNACFRFGSNESDIEIDNTLNASVDDIVAIEIRGSSMFKASVIAYGIPLVGLVVGVYLGSLISELYAALGGILLCAAAFFILRALNPMLEKRREFRPRMVRIVGRHEDGE